MAGHQSRKSGSTARSKSSPVETAKCSDHGPHPAVPVQPRMATNVVELEGERAFVQNPQGRISRSIYFISL